MRGSGIRWAICKSAPRSRQITTPAPHHSVFYRPDALPAAQPAASKHWRHCIKYHKCLRQLRSGYGTKLTCSVTAISVAVTTTAGHATCQPVRMLEHELRMVQLDLRLSLYRWCTVLSPHVTFSNEDHHIWMSHEWPCFICFVVWPITSLKYDFFS